MDLPAYLENRSFGMTDASARFVHILGDSGRCLCLMPHSHLTLISDSIPRDKISFVCKSCRDMAKHEMRTVPKYQAPAMKKAIARSEHRKNKKRQAAFNKAIRKANAIVNGTPSKRRVKSAASWDHEWKKADAAMNRDSD